MLAQLFCNYLAIDAEGLTFLPTRRRSKLRNGDAVFVRKVANKPYRQ
jgi:hypothetical protein